MPSYSNRHQYQEPMQLGPHGGSGDFEAGAYHQGYAPVPRAPRMPALSERHGGHLVPAQTGPFRPISGSHFPPPTTNRHAVPAAPHSLSPVAMGTARAAVATGPQVTQDAMEAAPRPSAKAGMSILLAGAIIGGLIGAVMHVRQNAADAFAAAAAQQQSHEVAESNGVAPAAPNPNALPSHVIAPPSRDADGIKEPKVADGKKDDETKAKESKKKTKWAWKGPAVKTTTAAVVPATDADDEDAPAKTTKASKKAASNKDDDGYTIASAGGDDGADSAPPVKTKTTDVTKASDTKKKGADKAVAKDDAPAPKKSSGKSDDAVSVLKAAMGATENSL